MVVITAPPFEALWRTGVATSSLLLFRLRRGLLLRLPSPGGLGADEHHGHDARLAAAHAPGVVRAALHEDVAGAKELLLRVQDRVDLALEHDDVVHRAGLVHHRVARRLV